MSDEVFVIREIDGEMYIDKWQNKNPPLMRCGHTASGTTEIPDSDGKGTVKIYCCPSCYGIIDGANVIADEQPSLEGRKAKCIYCGKIADSSYGLPFFGYNKDKEYDEYYCGCMGWD